MGEWERARSLLLVGVAWVGDGDAQGEGKGVREVRRVLERVGREVERRGLVAGGSGSGVVERGARMIGGSERGGMVGESGGLNGEKGGGVGERGGGFGVERVERMKDGVERSGAGRSIELPKENDRINDTEVDKENRVLRGVAGGVGDGGKGSGAVTTMSDAENFDMSFTATATGTGTGSSGGGREHSRSSFTGTGTATGSSEGSFGGGGGGR
ncbi:hypothetical protein HDV00_006725, partial [Rhizophlyctis rosea]